MAKKSKFIKNLLTTASAAAMFVGGSQMVAVQGALGAEVNTTGTPVNITGGGTLSGALADSIKVHTDNVVIATGGGVAVKALDVNGKTGVTLEIDTDSSFGSIGNGKTTTAAGPVVGQTIATQINNGITLTLDGSNTNSSAPVPVKTYVGLGDITFEGGVGNSKLDITLGGGASTLFGNVIGNAGAGTGKVNITDATVITFRGLLGSGTALDELKVSDSAGGAILDAQGGTANAPKVHNITAVSLNAANSLLKINDHNKLVGAVTNTGATRGKIEFTANGEITGNASTVGGNRLTEVKVSGAGTAKIGGEMHTTALVLNDNAAILDITGAAKHTANGGVYAFTKNATLIARGGWDGGIAFADKTATFSFAGIVTGDINDAAANNNGTVNILGAAQLNGQLGANNGVGVLNLNQAAIAEFKGVAYKALNTKFNADATLKFGNSASIVEGNIVNNVMNNGAQVNNQGTINVTGGGANALIINGTVGADGAALKNILFSANQPLTTKGAGLWAQTITPDNGAGGQGTLNIGGEGVGGLFTLSSSTSTVGANQKLNALNIVQKVGNGATIATINGTIRATAIALDANANHHLILGAGTNLIGQTTFNTALQQLSLGEGAAHTGNLVSANGGEGIINVKGNALIKGTAVGVGVGNKLNEIKFAEATTKTLTIQTTGAGTTATNAGIKFDTHGILNFEGDFNQVVTSPVVIAAGTAEGLGAIEFDDSITAGKVLSITGAIGDHTDNAKRLRLLHNQSGSNLTLAGGHVHINEYQFGADTKLTLNAAGGKTYRFDRFTANGTGTLEIAQNNVTIQTRNINEGTEASLFEATKLKHIDITGDHVVNIADGSLLRATKLRTNAVNNGDLVFLGDAVFDAPTAAELTGGAGQSELKTIHIGGGADGKVVDYRSDLHINGDIDFAKNSTFKFSGSTLITNKGTAGNGFTGNKGKVVFANTLGSQNIQALVAAGTAVEFSGGNVTFNQALATQSYKFNSKEAMVADLNTSDISGASFTVTPDNGVKHTVRFSNNGVNLDGQLGNDKPIIFEVNANALTISKVGAAKEE